MIERDAAVRTVEEELARDHRRESALGLTPLRMAVSSVRRHELVWIVCWTTEEYLRSRDPGSALVGNGPYLVDRVDGSLHQIGVVAAKTGAWEADYRARIRGEAARTAVDDLHDEVRAQTDARGRVHAMRALRRSVPALTHGQAAAYVTALRHGEVPAPLLAVATEALVPPVEHHVRTVLGAEPDETLPAS
ncbi:YrhB domain-containing protein [Streptomyces sp. NPDC058052]|uniref:YrhB domain-containing protein n=1 Tax=Streptomyces sp. NPDC058052 TaxID=3346316 RepID=UPI0036EEC9BA